MISAGSCKVPRSLIFVTEINIRIFGFGMYVEKIKNIKFIFYRSLAPK